MNTEFRIDNETTFPVLTLQGAIL